MRFPIKELISPNIVELYVLADPDTVDDCLLDCPCCSENMENSIASIGSYYCRKNCENSVSNGLETPTIKCNNKYWIKILIKEYYKNHGELF